MLYSNTLNYADDCVKFWHGDLVIDLSDYDNSSIIYLFLNHHHS